MHVAVVGHTEWVHFARVTQMPASGDIVHAREWWELPGGGGAGGAVQLAKLAGSATFFTAFGDDELGRRAHRELTDLGLDVEAAFRPTSTRRAFTHIDAQGERTITVMGERLAPRADDPLPWDRLDGADAVFLSAGDVGAVRRARRAQVLVATTRIIPLLQEARVELDAVVGSALDPSEAYERGALDPRPRLVVATRGDQGGTWQTASGEPHRFAAPPPPGPVVDRYGAGDSFAGALTYALGRVLPVDQAVALAARCGAAALTGRGPYEGQLTIADLGD